MQALRVVNGLYESTDVLAGIICILIGETLHLFLFQGFHEALRLRIVVRIADTAYACLDAAAMQKFGIGPARVLGGFNRSSQHPFTGGEIDDRKTQI
ncbi:hypothetical protein NKJ58_29030 [Mesorhizobium sp. M0139]